MSCIMGKVYESFIATRAPEEEAKADTSATSIGQYLLAWTLRISPKGPASPPSLAFVNAVGSTTPPWRATV